MEESESNIMYLVFQIFSCVIWGCTFSRFNISPFSLRKKKSDNATNQTRRGGYGPRATRAVALGVAQKPLYIPLFLHGLVCVFRRLLLTWSSTHMSLDLSRSPQ